MKNILPLKTKISVVETCIVYDRDYRGQKVSMQVKVDLIALIS